MSNPLAEVSILLNLQISQWTGEISDRKALAAVAKAFKGDVSRDKYRKALFVTDALGPVHKAGGRIRTHYYRKTLNWADGGSRLVPSMEFRDFGREHSKLVSEFEQEVDTFVADYPEHKENAKDQKGDLFNEHDYPDIEGVRSKFSVKLIALPFPKTTDFRVQAPEEIIIGLRAQIDASLLEVQNTVGADIRGRIQERLTKLHDGLAGGKRFSQTLFDEIALVTDMGLHMEAALAPALNSVLLELKNNLLVVTADQLRNSESLKKTYIDRTRALLQQL
jgi:hypothetical protein